MSAVIQILEEEKILEAGSVSVQGGTPLVEAPRHESFAWTSYGRQTTMSNRALIQRRVIRR